MPEPPHDEVNVLAGTHGRLRWQVFDGDQRVAWPGFGGPALYPDRKVNAWRGRTDSLPCFVMARAAPEVSRLVAVTGRGTHVELVMGEVDARFRLRFATAGLPGAEGPGMLLVEVDGHPDGSLSQAMGRPPVGPAGQAGPRDCWRPP